MHTRFVRVGLKRSLNEVSESVSPSASGGILAQLEKIGRRIAYWNARLRSVLKGQLSKTATRAASKALRCRD